MNDLTPKQDRFAEEYLVDLNATQAAIRAGYSENTAAEQGYQLLHKTLVQKRISDLQTEVRERTEVTVDSVIAKLELLRDEAVERGQMGPAIRAEELIGKTIGAFMSVTADLNVKPSRDEILQSARRLLPADAVAVLEKMYADTSMD